MVDVEPQIAEAAARQFSIPQEIHSIDPHGNGHINDTFCVTARGNGTPKRFILQRINTHIFRAPGALMENVERVTAHLARQTATDPDSERKVLTLIPTREGEAWHIDSEGGCWRMYRFIEGARTVDAVGSKEQAFEAARAFGRFQAQLADLPAPRLHETIPGFHHTPGRLDALERAIAADTVNRAAGARAEIDFALSRKPMARVLLDAGLPERITHNDTKINNVLLDDLTGEGICVIDLDTVMPGLAPYDFGDLARTALCQAAEDERDLSKVEMEFELFEALLRGFLDTTSEFLTRDEKRLLPFSCRLITFNIGVRFLTDHLAGDTYFKIHREGQNLDRARTQFKLVESIERNEEAMNRLVESLAG
ncbi:MAG: aminoglycoside phosphotransferase family protein [Terracidiphilus sp.]